MNEKTKLYKQIRTGTLHRLDSCGLTRRTHVRNIPVELTIGELSQMIESGNYRLCEKCATASATAPLAALHAAVERGVAEHGEIVEIAARVEAGELVSEKSISDRDFLAPLLEDERDPELVTADALDRLSRQIVEELEDGATHYTAAMLVGHLIARNENGYCAPLDPYLLRPMLAAIAVELEQSVEIDYAVPTHYTIGERFPTLELALEHARETNAKHVHVRRLTKYAAGGSTDEVIGRVPVTS